MTGASDKSPPERRLIDEFADSYVREFDHYQEAARLCQQRCELLLGPRGIRAIVTHRAKNPNKLLAKLEGRAKTKFYETIGDIRSDIVDLAGVRVALYFPGDRQRVEQLIEDNFLVEEKRTFPIAGRTRADKRFSGYNATHFRLFLLPSSLPDDQKKYSAARIEIQLGSVLMHAWAEVEHDLVYKPESGELSEDEHAILDELNGLVLSGEIALERLQRAVERRLTAKDVKFDSHYELAAYLHKAARSVAGQAEPPMGRVDALWELLKKADITSPDKLSTIIEGVDFEAIDTPIADQIADAVLATRLDLVADFVSLQTRLPGPSAYSFANMKSNDLKTAIGEFLSSWIVLERTFSLLAGHLNIAGRISPFRNSRLIQLIELPAGSERELERLRTIRNNLVHGIEVPGNDYLRQAAVDLDGFLGLLENHSDERVRGAFNEARRSIIDPKPE